MASDSSPPTRYASLFKNGRSQAVRTPKEFVHKRLTAVLAELGPIDIDFPDVDAGLPALEQPEL